jgi:hypothetical protein
MGVLMSSDAPNPESIVFPTTSSIVAESEAKVADARQALADYTHQKIQSMAQSVPPAPVAPQVPQVPQQYQQAPYPPVQVTAQFGQPQYPPQPQYPVAPQVPQQQMPPQQPSTLGILIAVNTLLDGYEAKAPGIYPPELRTAVVNEINKLKSYQEKIDNISKT